MKLKFNQQSVCTNIYQGFSKRVLCVCSAGVLRSPTAAIVLNREYGYNTRAVGIHPEFALIPVTEALLFWATEIIVMEEEHVPIIAKLLADASLEREITCLNIPDEYAYMQSELIDLIKTGYATANPAAKPSGAS